MQYLQEGNLISSPRQTHPQPINNQPRSQWEEGGVESEHSAGCLHLQDPQSPDVLLSKTPSYYNQCCPTYTQHFLPKQERFGVGLHDIREK